jgi:branched-chain amino acid transport system ATP-binding protein
MSQNILLIDEIDASYGQASILNEISISVADEEIVGIIGRNGVGKTTLIKTVIGILSTETGNIYYQGENINSLTANERAQEGIGYIPQGRDVFPDLTVEQNIRMGLSINEHKSEDLVDEVYEYFPRLDERRKQKAGTMSGGEQQMLAIGRALAGNPDLLLLDEPSEGIQPSIVQQITHDIKQINEELGIAILFVEQNLQMIQSLSDRSYVIDNGRIKTELSESDLDNKQEIAEYLTL